MSIAQRTLMLCAVLLLLTACGVADTGRPAGQQPYPEPQQQAEAAGSYPVPVTPIVPTQVPEIFAAPTAIQSVSPMIGVLVSPNGEVLYIAPGSPSSYTDLQVGDLLESLDTITVANNRDEVRGHISKTRPAGARDKNGSPIEMHVDRKGAKHNIPVTPERPMTWTGTLPDGFTYPKGSFYL